MHNKDTNKLTLPAAIIVAGLLIAGAIMFTKTPTVVTEKETVNAVQTSVTADDHIRGNRDAKIVFIEYSDTECPYCKTFHEELKTIVELYPNDVAWVYRHFPLDGLHKKARKEAEATECVAELGGNDAFWQYLDLIFRTTPSNDGLDEAELPILAGRIGIDQQAFNECLASGRHADKVESDLQMARLLGGEGTPYTIIVLSDGRSVPVSGAKDAESLKQFIEATL